ncbi:MAG: ATP-binding protein [Calditrichaceae bacterium]
MNNELISRLESLPGFTHIPTIELNWLIQHGRFEKYEPGLILKKGNKIEYLWIILLGGISVHIDRGAGPKVANPELKIGAVTGMLPYSRLQGIPGDLYVDDKTEILSISTSYFPEMIKKCPKFTAHTVHTMIDRARIHNTSAMQDEKMLSLGRMSAGLAHELNNPASVLLRDTKLLREYQTEAYRTISILQKAGLKEKQFKEIEDFHLRCNKKSQNTALTPIQKSDLEDRIFHWMSQNHINTIHSVQLADLAVDINDLDKLRITIPSEIFETALQWIVASCNLHNLSLDIEQATNQIYKLVEIVKKFTSMDNLAERELVNVQIGINDTLRMLDSKTKSKNAEITLKIEKNFPMIYANGAALNQVWFNLLDNALDAIPDSGNIKIYGRLKNDQIIIKFIDNGSGISADTLDRIFDPFYTTKSPGQGTGLGLDLSRKIVRAHKGDICVSSTKGQTEFSVYLNVDKN